MATWCMTMAFCRFEVDGPASQPEPELEDGQALAELARSHASTDDEVRLLCSDLQVLGRSEFKQLIRWCVPHALFEIQNLLRMPQPELESLYSLKYCSGSKLQHRLRRV